jgi:hypothetical protein
LKPAKLFTYFIFISLIFEACSHTKRGELGQGIQNFNSRYNTYFNAREKFYVAYNNIKAQYKDNYSYTLPLYEMEACTDKFMAQADMNVIEEKVGKIAIKYYTSRWADDGIMLWGKTLYLKGEYQKAIKIFTYITAAYKKGFKTDDLRKPKGNKITKKEQKIREAEKTQIPITEGFFEHTPKRNEAMLWLARCYIQLEKFNEAQAILSYAESDMTFPKEYRTELIKAQADLYIKRNNRQEAIHWLNQLLAKTKTKRTKARYFYISGQIFELMNNRDSAFNRYELSLENNPDDDMEFYAKIKLANLSGGIDSKKGEDILMKMIRDEKNEEYLDILYHKLGELKKQQKDFKKADMYFLKSTALSKNNHQKALAYLSLAELYEEQESYSIAKKWYDSTVAGYNPKLPELKTIMQHSTIIGNLGGQQAIIQNEDSLQFLAKMGKEKAKKYLTTQLEQQKKSALKNNTEFVLKKPDNIKLVGTDKWYFGNLNLILSGINEFKKNWGERKLEDNWRRKNKRTEFSANSSEERTTKDSSAAEESIESVVQNTLKQIPFDEPALKVSKNKIQLARFAMALIYKDDLFQFNKSIDILEDLLANNPAQNLRPKIIFHLYVNNTLLKNQARAAYYKNLLLGDHPEDALVKNLNKPIDTSVQAEEKYYDSTFQYFNESKYDTTIDRCNLYKTFFPKELFKAKIQLLKAMSLGRLYQYDEYILALNELATKLPGTKEGAMAKDLLNRFMNSDLKRIEDSTLKAPKPITYTNDESKLAIVGKLDTTSKIAISNTAISKENNPINLQQTSSPDKKDTVKIPYEYNFKPAHAYLFILLDESKSIDIQTKIDNYNAKNFSALNLRILPIKMGKFSVFIVQEFTDGGKASFYNKFIQADKEVLSGLENKDYHSLIISSANLSKFLPAKDIEGYLQFYKEHYKN